MAQVAFPHPPSHHPNHSLQGVRGTPASARVGGRPRSNPPSSSILAQVTHAREALPRKTMGSPGLQGEEAPPPLLSLRTGWAPGLTEPPGGERAWSEFSASALVRTPEMTRCLEGSHSGPKPHLPLPAGRPLWSRSLAPRKACRGHPASPWPGRSDTEQSLASGAQGLSPSSLPVPASADHIAPQPQLQPDSRHLG